jgi:hypothetical protein
MDINKVVPKQVQQPMPPAPPGQQGPQGGNPTAPNQETLQNGAAVTDNFSPNKMRAI